MRYLFFSDCHYDIQKIIVSALLATARVVCGAMTTVFACLPVF